MVKGLVAVLVALLLVAPTVSAHGDSDTLEVQEQMIGSWLQSKRLATVEEAEALVEELGYPSPASPAERFDGYVVREDLATAGDLDGAKRVMRFAHITDLQLVDDDAPSPMRVGVLDEVFAATISGGGERPQEEYSDEIMHSLVDIVNAHHGIDPFDFALHTGDNIDNALENELMRYIDIVEGTHTTVGPVSGFTCLPDGQSESTEDSANDVTNSCTSLPEHVVPELRGLADDLPWYSLYGNHDGLIQGNVPVEPSFQEAAENFGRHFLHQDDYVRMHFDDLDACGGGSEADDFGHGYGFAGDRLCDESVENDAYYAYDHQGIRFIVLDTVNDEVQQSNSNSGGTAPDESTSGHDFASGLSEGAIDNVQWNWLVSELDAASNKVVILVAHHTITAFYSDYFDAACGPPGCAEDALRAAGFRGRDDVKELIAGYPNIVSFIGGHTHRHAVNAEVGGLYGSHPGFWNIETSGMLDLPQESRIIEVWITADGTKGVFALDPIGHQFQLAKDLAATDPDEDSEANHGAPEDRQVLLWFDMPAAAGLPILGTQPPGGFPDDVVLNFVSPELENGEIITNQTGPLEITLEVLDLEGNRVEDATVASTISSLVPDPSVPEEDIPVFIAAFTPMQTQTVAVDTPEGGFEVVQFVQTLDLPVPGTYTLSFLVSNSKSNDGAGDILQQIPVTVTPPDPKETPAMPAVFALLALLVVAALRRQSTQ